MSGTVRLKLYKGTIALSDGCTVQEAYQYLQYITREDSAATVAGLSSSVRL